MDSVTCIGMRSVCGAVYPYNIEMVRGLDGGRPGCRWKYTDGNSWSKRWQMIAGVSCSVGYVVAPVALGCLRLICAIQPISVFRSVILHAQLLQIE